MKQLAISLTIFGLGLTSYAQDVHFAQFDKSPMSINPGLTGIGKGFNRMNLNYRTQWGSLNKAYSTMAFSYDMPILSSSMGDKNSYVGVGINFFSDRAGDARFTTNHFGLSFSGILLANKQNTLSLGINTAFEQRSANNQDNVSWDNQWTGSSYNPSLPSGEAFGNQSHSYFDISTGLAWKFVEKNLGISAFDKLSFTTGIAYFHMNRPSHNFYSFNGDDKKYGKLVIHAVGTFGLKDNYITISPSAFYSYQGPYRNLLVGGIFRYLFRSDTKYTGFLTEKAIGFGVHVRGKDAIIPTIVFEVAGIEFGLNYDYTISTLQKANNGVGGFEFSLKWNDTYGVLFNQGDKHVLFLD